MNWTCPRCKSENEVATDYAFTPYPQQTCASCGLVVDAQVDDLPKPPPVRPQPEPAFVHPETAEALKQAKKPKRRKPQSWATAFLVFFAVAAGLAAITFSSQLTAGIVLACGALGTLVLAGIYHIGERLDLILEELQNGNDERSEKPK